MVFIDFAFLRSCSWRLDLPFPWTTKEKRVLFSLGEQTLKSCRLPMGSQGPDVSLFPLNRDRRFYAWIAVTLPCTMNHGLWTMDYGLWCTNGRSGSGTRPHAPFIPLLLCFSYSYRSPIVYPIPYTTHSFFSSAASSTQGFTLPSLPYAKHTIALHSLHHGSSSQTSPIVSCSRECFFTASIYLDVYDGWMEVEGEKRSTCEIPLKQIISWTSESALDGVYKAQHFRIHPSFFPSLFSFLFVFFVFVINIATTILLYFTHTHKKQQHDKLLVTFVVVLSSTQKRNSIGKPNP